jgi:hypothetical protein
METDSSLYYSQEPATWHILSHKFLLSSYRVLRDRALMYYTQISNLQRR